MQKDTEMSTHEVLLKRLNTCIVTKNYAEFNELLSEAQLQFSTALSFHGQEVTEFLANMKQIMSEDSYPELDYDMAVDVVGQIVRMVSFDQILGVFEVGDLMNVFNSNVPSLIKLACRVIQRSDPKGLFAGSGLIDLLLIQLFDTKTDVGVIAEIESALKELSCDVLIRRRILGDNAVLLMRTKTNSDPICTARLLELLQSIFPYANSGELNNKLFIFSGKNIIESIDRDIFLFIAITNYYSRLLEVVRNKNESGHSGARILNHILNEVIPTYGKLYREQETHFTAWNYGRKYIFNLVKEISLLRESEYFRLLDEKYLHITASNPDFLEFLKFVNPAYLIENQGKAIMDMLRVTPSHLAVFRNLISNESSFNTIKEKLNADRILEMPYIEQMVLLQKLTSYDYSAYYLLNNLSKVMSNVVDDKAGRITEPETFELRREVLENLLLLPNDFLNVWADPIKKSYRGITTGSEDHGSFAEVADVYL
ncbi:LANO_0F06260g1_1 [Lachancea nothofagi CBS 11611]|uniref:DNA mismatch repair protein HSM3 n=1 Tax=Lachancea nothofagi CBS 11611 TaxID=1266666 RepID=A0A1G4K8E5_9SACH|nr:LANO_0F06260g1_1 [Lachancea nothofagi CBS 11611]